MARTSLADVIKEWKQLLATVAANKADLPTLEEYRVQLETELAGAEEESIRQATLQAGVQQTTRNLEGFLTRGREAAVRMRSGIRSKYGLKSEKLTEFGMKPQRKRKASKEKPPPVVEGKPAPQADSTEASK
ncbi:MAG: hypothetical protein ACJ75H_08625 [Thermoanaerobaculia bacterium]